MLATDNEVGTMALQLKQTWCATLGKQTWKVPESLIHHMPDGSNWLQLVGYNYGLYSLVMSTGADKVKVPHNASLCASAGFIELKRLRNEAVAALQCAEAETGNPKSNLFGEHQVQSSKKRKKTIQGGALGSTVTITLPPFADRASFALECLIPLLLQQDVVVPLEADVLDPLIAWLHHHAAETSLAPVPQSDYKTQSKGSNKKDSDQDE